MKNSCIKAIAADKGEMAVNMCKMIGKCENKDCRCKKHGVKKQNEEIELKA